MNPVDAEQLGLETGETVLITSKWGKCLRPLMVIDTIMPGVLAMGQGAWVEIDEETGIDMAGSMNVLCGRSSRLRDTSLTTAPLFAWINGMASRCSPTTCGKPAKFSRRSKSWAQKGFLINSAECTAARPASWPARTCTASKSGPRARIVREVCGGGWTVDEKTGACTPAQVFSYSVSYSCGHCENPACVEVCPTGAHHKDEETGIVSTPPMTASAPVLREGRPYGAPQFVEAKTITEKCDMCAELQAHGEEPAWRGHLPAARPEDRRHRRAARRVRRRARHPALARLCPDRAQRGHRGPSQRPRGRPTTTGACCRSSSSKKGEPSWKC